MIDLPISDIKPSTNVIDSKTGYMTSEGTGVTFTSVKMILLRKYYRFLFHVIIFD